MKRLTNARNRCVFCKAADEECAFAAGEFSAPCPDYKTYQRLSAIEDILGDDYDLDRLKDLVQADREGKVILRKTKEGSKVYIILLGRIFPFDVISATWNSKNAVYEAEHGKYLRYMFNDADIGISVFLTREEAEAVLQNHKDQEKLPEAYQHQIMSRFCRKD